uniref:Uncharacterized protein n=1 Tax=Acrobeloides nanus TaxID=290746 RepID=A0A914E3P4_9BILA
MNRYPSYPPTTAVFHATSEPTLTAPMDSNVYGNSIPYHQQQHVYPSQNTYPSATTVPYPRYGFVRPYAPYEIPNRVPISYGQAASYNTNQYLNQDMETLFISSPQDAQMDSPNYEANMSQMNSPNYASTNTSCTSNYSEPPTPPGMFTNIQETPVIQPANSIQVSQLALNKNTGCAEIIQLPI